MILAGPGAVSEHARHRRTWLSGAMQNAVGGIITAAILALVAYLAAYLACDEDLYRILEFQV